MTLVVLRIRPAAPRAAADSLWIDTVRAGPLVRQVRARGTLIPQDLRFVAAPSDGRVELIRIRPGTAVQPETILVELSNPDIEHAAFEAQSQMAVTEAELADLRAKLDMQLMSLRAEEAGAASEAHQAALDADVEEKLARDGLASEVVVKKARAKAEEAKARSEFTRQRLEAARRSLAAELAAQQVRVQQARAVAVLRQSQSSALHVRAGIAGVLEEIFIEPGQRVAPGTTLAKVADPQRLQAELKVAEAQAREIRTGQAAQIEVSGSSVAAHVVRVAPAVQNGTVSVSLAFDQQPTALRSDQSVTGVCEIERLSQAVFIARPAFGEENSTIRLFKVDPDGKEAVRVTVRLGASSAESIQVLDGLRPGDRVILSDTSRWDTSDHIRLD